MTDVTPPILAIREAASRRLGPARRAVVDRLLVEILEELFNNEKPPFAEVSEGKGICQLTRS